MMNIFLFGSGYSAHYFIRALRQNPAINIRSVTGTTRRADQAEALRENGIHPVLFDAEQGFNAQLCDELQQATHIISSIAPLTANADDADPVLRLMPEGLKYYAPQARFISYLSTIGVYGDYQGKWVDEKSELKPVAPSSIARATAEQQWLAQTTDTNIACTILRIAGIYGPSFNGQARNALANIKNGRTQRLIKKDHVFNRIHVEDIGGALAHMAVSNLSGIYNLTDNKPAPAHEMMSYAAKLLGVTLPPAVDFETSVLSPIARSFYLECKRASNAKLKATGYQLLNPDYHTGLEQLFEQGEGC